jgi:hypothetical protein
MANRLTQATSLALALLCPVSGWTAGILRLSPRAGSEAVGLSVSNLALAGNVFDFRTCEAVLDGNRDFGLFRVKLAPPHVTSQPAWSTNGGSYRYEWTYPEGITVRFEAIPRAELVELTYTVVNHTPETLKQVHLHTCVTTTEAPAFFPQLTTGRGSQLPSDTRDQDYTELLTRLFVWSGGQPLRLDRTEHARRQVHLSLLPKGGPPIEWAWWINSTNTFDEPLIAAASHDGQWTAGLWFERAAWASANSGDDRACFHLFPLFGRIECGASATVRGAFFFVRGSPEALRVRAQQRAEPGQRRPSTDGQRQPDRK